MKNGVRQIVLQLVLMSSNTHCITIRGPISIVTLAEIRFGIELLPDLSRRSELNDRLSHKVRPMFEQRVADFRGRDASRTDSRVARYR